MKINLAAKYLVLAVVGGALVSPIAALAQPRTKLDPKEPWADACVTALTNAVKADHPHAGRVQTSADDSQYQASNAETGVTGNGQYEGTEGWVKFNYTCIYNIRSGSVTDLKYDVYDVQDINP